MFLLTSLAEVIGIASIMPFIAVLANPDVVHTNIWLANLYDFLEFQSTKHFLFFLGSSVWAALILTNSIKALARWLTLHVTHGWGEGLARRLFEICLYQPYSFFLERNTSDLSKNILSEVHAVTSHVIVTFIDIIAKLIVATSILIFLAVMDPVLSIVIIILIGGQPKSSSILNL